MKNSIYLTLFAILIGLFVFNSDSFAQGKGKGQGGSNSAPKSNFVDENGDGICDNFIDENGDGICDHCTGTGEKSGSGNQYGKGKGQGGVNFLDEDGDGICDHRTQDAVNGQLKKSDILTDVSYINFNNGIAIGHQKVNFNLKEACIVIICVYDQSGNLVQELYNGEMNKGPQQITIDTTNYPAGVYYYVLEYAGKVISKQFTVVK